ncbi:hypothetical protein DAI22_02g167400 [Oryza sativa Japonica Group]|nr:hypothetical protein DAI22_02g167400 [Oryza sativa Japonica Group]
MPPEPGLMSCVAPSWFSSARSQGRDDEPRPHTTPKRRAQGRSKAMARVRARRC